jgi:hypothetical protein
VSQITSIIIVSESYECGQWVIGIRSRFVGVLQSHWYYPESSFRVSRTGDSM